LVPRNSRTAPAGLKSGPLHHWSTPRKAITFIVTVRQNPRETELVFEMHDFGIQGYAENSDLQVTKQR
jgi:hypothetical protein